VCGAEPKRRKRAPCGPVLASVVFQTTKTTINLPPIALGGLVCPFGCGFVQLDGHARIPRNQVKDNGPPTPSVTP